MLIVLVVIPDKIWLRGRIKQTLKRTHGIELAILMCQAIEIRGYAESWLHLPELGIDHVTHVDAIVCPRNTGCTTKELYEKLLKPGGEIHWMD